jgi:OmpA-OmpF porin, OOP family
MKKIASALLLSAAISAPAFAADQGAYLGAKLGPTTYGYTNVANNGQLGLGIFGGFQFNKNFAVELEYASLGGFDANARTYKGTSFGASAVGTLPLDEKFALVGKAGLASTNIGVGASSYAATGITLGVAGQYSVSSEFDLRAGFDMYPVGNATINTTTATMLSIGGLVRF